MRTSRAPAGRLVAPAMVFLAATACSGAAAPDAGPPDAGEAPMCNPNLPPPSAPCLEGQCGNALGVGQPCTAGGNECADLPFGTHASFCTVDFEDTDLWYCTKACTEDSQCGEGAVCTVDPDVPGSASGCLPASCRD
jgi:hypothetical protein